jgi:hypothetical protein
MAKSFTINKCALLAGLLGTLAFSAKAVPEFDYHWSSFDVFTDGGGNPYAYFQDPANWDSAVVPAVTNASGQYIRVMLNQSIGSHVPAWITNNIDMYQLMIGTGGNGGGDVVITNGAQVTAGKGLEGGPTQWTGLGFPDGPSTLYIGPGCSLSTGDHLWIGNGNNANDVGTVTIDGGTLTVQGQFGLGWNGFPGTTNYATVKNGGHLALNQWATPTLGQNGSVGILNIADNSSSVTINGNVTGYFAALTNSMQLIAYGGTGRVTWNYNPSGNLTTILAVAPPDLNTPVFSAEPTNAIVALGSPASLTVHVSNVSVNYGWLYNGANLVDGAGITGSHSATLNIASVGTGNVGNYICMATNSSFPTEFTASTVASVNGDSFNLYPVITVAGVNGNSYAVQWTASLTAPVTWNTLATVTVGAAPQQVVDTGTPLSLSRFYRVLQTAP